MELGTSGAFPGPFLAFLAARFSLRDNLGLFVFGVRLFLLAM